MPDLRELLADPARTRTLTHQEAATAAAEIAARQVELAALQAAIAGRMQSPGDSPGSRDLGKPDDRLLTPQEVADRLRSSLRFVYRNAKRWPFTRVINRKKVLFSEVGLRRYLEQRKP